MIQVLAEFNKTENRKTVEKINEPKDWFFEKKIRERLTKIKRENTALAR